MEWLEDILRDWEIDIRLSKKCAKAIREEIRKRIEGIPKEYWKDSVTVHLPLVEIDKAIGLEEGK